MEGSGEEGELHSRGNQRMEEGCRSEKRSIGNFAERLRLMGTALSANTPTSCSIYIHDCRSTTAKYLPEHLEFGGQSIENPLALYWLMRRKPAFWIAAMRMMKILKHDTSQRCQYECNSVLLIASPMRRSSEDAPKKPWNCVSTSPTYAHVLHGFLKWSCI